MMTTLSQNTKAPAFQLAASNGQTVSNQDYLGQKNMVLYFYPKDDTPGCTTEACEFRDAIGDIEQYDTVVLGVSPDGLAKHQKFIEKFQLPFLLLCDEDHLVCERYGVWVEKSNYGRKYLGVARTTFIIDKQGQIVRMFEKVKPAGHHQEVLDVLKAL